LWICVIITAGIILTGWGVSMKYNFTKINEEMDQNVGQSFEEAEQEVLGVFDGMNQLIQEETKDLSFSSEQAEILEEVTAKVEDSSNKILEQKD